MRRRVREKTSPAGLGLISMITAMFLLTLAVFAVLTLASARADYALTRRGADNVAAYYRADMRAAALAEEFARGTEAELYEVLPITEMQGLSIHLLRREDGGVAVLRWQVVLLDDFSDMPDDYLPVWQ